MQLEGETEETRERKNEREKMREIKRVREERMLECVGWVNVKEGCIVEESHATQYLSPS